MNQWWLLALLISYIFVGGCVYEWQSDKCTAKIETQDVAQQKVTIGAENNVIIKERADNAATQEVSNAYQTHIKAIDDLYATANSGLLHQQQPAAGNGMPPVSGGHARHNAATCPNVLSLRDKQNLEKLGDQADLQTAQLQECQAFLTVHGQVQK